MFAFTIRHTPASISSFTNTRAACRHVERVGCELAFAPLAVVRRLRPWLWSGMVMIHLSLILLIDFADLSVGMLMMHVFTFDPGWLTRSEARGTLDPIWSLRSTETLSSWIGR